MPKKVKSLEYGKVYHNRGGGDFCCTTPHFMGYPDGVERMTNVKTGWTFRAHGIVQYEDGSIEWDYSTGGYFEEGWKSNAGRGE